MTFYDTFDDSFFISISISFFAFCGLAVRGCLRSNCKSISCCCISCERYEKELPIDLNTPTLKKNETFSNNL